MGAPIHGLRVRQRRIMPVLRGILTEMARTLDRPPRVLDLGCGTGLFTMGLARSFPGCQVIGLDNWGQLVEKDACIAQSAGLDNCSFQLGDALDLIYAQEFDLAVCIDNLEHVEDDQQVLDNLFRALKPGGMAVIHVPGLYRRWLFWAKKQNFEVKGHVRPGYLLEDISGKVTRAGFQVIQASHTYGWLETVTNNISYLITGADRRRKHLYALAFPVLNALAYWGQWSRPAWGAGVLLVARRPAQ
jgi:2-polyprenyl-3-methyl-5-hydroxy-6-metoxy-1,4-benzoquinol methylase